MLDCINYRKNILLFDELRFYYHLTMADKTKVYLIGRSNLVIFKMPSRYFIRLCNENSFSFLFLNYHFFKNFVNSFMVLQRKMFFYYFFRFKLKGLGYRIKRISKYLYRFFFISVNYFYLHLPKTVIFKYKKRRMFLLSSDWVDLRILVVNLLLLKCVTIYRLRGFSFPKRVIMLKPGKKRF